MKSLLTRVRFAGLLIWPRHKLSWLVGGLVAAAMGLIVIPGEQVPPRDAVLGYRVRGQLVKPAVQWLGGGGSFGSESFASPRPAPDYAIEYSHGWPLEWLRRGNAYGGMDWPKYQGWDDQLLKYPLDHPYNTVSWSALNAWPIQSDAWQVSWTGLLLNATVVAVLVIVATTVVEWRAKRRRHWHSLTIRDALAFVLAISVVFGWWARHKHTQRREQAIAGVSAVFNGYSYGGPVWLAKLAGNRYALNWMWHVTDARLDIGDHAILKESCQQLPYVEGIALGLGEHERIDSCSVVQALSEAGRLRRLSFFSRKLGDYCYIYSEDIEPFCALDGLKEIDVRDVLVSKNGLTTLRQKYADIRFVTYGDLPTDLDIAICRLKEVGWRPRRFVDPTVELELTSVDATETLLGKIGALKQSLRELKFGERSDARAALDFAGECPELSRLTLPQGNLTAGDLRDWINHHATRDVWLQLVDSNLKPIEVQAIVDAIGEHEQRHDADASIEFDAYSSSEPRRENRLVGLPQRSEKQAGALAPFDARGSAGRDASDEDDPFADF